jgi:hypothetical protein
MTKLYLLTFKCTRCNKLFWSYFEPVDDADKEMIKQYFEKDDFSFIIKNLRECRQCRKGQDMLMFTDKEWFINV